jgi:hypothetical protein
MNKKYKFFLEKTWYLNFFDKDYINLKKINNVKNSYILEYKKRIYPDIFKFD